MRIARYPKKRSLLLFLLIGVVVLLPAGCNIVAPAVVMFSPPPSRPAEYQLADRPTVVFVDDRGNKLPRRNLRVMIGDAIAQQLMIEEVLTDTITTRDALAVANRETDDALLSMEDIGRAVGAEQLIYVQMTGYVDSFDGIRRRPAASCEVSVIDISNRARLFPTSDSATRTRTVEIISPREFPESAMSSAAARRVMQDDMAKIIGEKVAKLFYKHLIENSQITTEITR